MELIYITLAVYGMGAATALFPKKMEMAAHYCAVLAAVFGSGALLYQSAAYLMQGSGSLLSGSWNINYRSLISLQKSYMYRFSTIWSGLLLFCAGFSRAAYVCISVM